jgi:pimeloyl-ACP methyl ester carboxylesterase
MDHRGHGASGRPRGIEHHGIDAYVADVIAVADDLGIDRLSLFGYSDGAAVGYRLAARHPDRVHALVGLDTVGAEGETMRDRLERAVRIRDEGTEAVVTWLREAEPSLPEWFDLVLPHVIAFLDELVGRRIEQGNRL